MVRAASFWPAGLLAMLLGLLPAQVRWSRLEGGGVAIGNDRVRLLFRPASGGGYTEELQARQGPAWVSVAGGAGPGGETLRLRQNGKSRWLPWRGLRAQPGEAGRIALYAAAGPLLVTAVVTLDPGEPQVHYALTVHVQRRTFLESVAAHYRFRPDRAPAALYPLDVGWAPGQRLTPGRVLGDQLFCTPLVFMQKGGVALVLLADVARIPAERTFKTAMTYQAGTAAAPPGMSYGLLDYWMEGHVYFRHWPQMVYAVAPGRRLTWGYRLVAQAGADPFRAFRRAAGLAWRHLGRRRLRGTAAPQYAPFDRCVRAVYNWAFQSPFASLVWHEFTYRGLPCGGTMNYVTYDRQTIGQRTGQPLLDGLWFHSWYNNLRCAYGMALHGRQWGEVGLQARAARILNLALTAPMEGGLFPAVFSLTPAGPEPGRWRSATPYVPDRRRPDDFYYHLPDAAWTGYWLVRWYEDVAPDPRIPPRVLALGQGLMALQLPSGAFPTWVARKTLRPQPELFATASTAAPSLFLLRAARTFRRGDFLAAGLRGLLFLAAHVLPESRWWDFEALVSGVGPNLATRDPTTGLHDANTMSMFWAAGAFLEAYELFRHPVFLDLGSRVLDEAALYQHLWDKPWHFGIPSLGGFTSQNRDAEQNDARESVAAPLFLHYYRWTGREEYFYRGVAALRAGFTNTYLPENVPVFRMWNLIAPWFGPAEYGFTEENTFHFGYVGAPWVLRASNFTWGGGSAAAAVAEVRERFGDLYVDLRRERAFGVDGCVAALTQLGPDAWELRVSDAVGLGRTLRVVVEGVPVGKELLSRDPIGGSRAEVVPFSPVTPGVSVGRLFLPRHGCRTYRLEVH